MPVGVKLTSNPETPILGGQHTLFISVIVPVRNEAKHIEHVLDQLVNQDYDHERFEIIVVDGVSIDGTPDLVAHYTTRYTNIRLFSNPQRLSSAARNIGIRQARGEVMLILDGHCELDNNSLLLNVSKAFQRSAADCLGRPQPLEISDATPIQQAIALARSSRLGHHPDSFIYSQRECYVPAHSVAVAYRREVFGRVGYFDERFDACEDVELNHRIDEAGLRCFFTPSIQVRYRPRSSVLGLFRQLFRYGRGRVCLLRKHPESFAFGSFLPAMFWLGVLLGWTVAFLQPVLWVVYFAVLGLYAAAILVESSLISLVHKQARLLSLLPLILVTIHLASAAGVIGELLAGIRIRRLFSGESN